MDERHCIFCDSVGFVKSEWRREPESELAVVIRKYFNFTGIDRLLAPLQNKNDNNLINNPSTLFCTKCADKLVVLSRLDEELEKIQCQMSIIISTLSMEILNVNSTSNNTKIKKEVGLFRNAVHNHYKPKVKVADCMKENVKCLSSRSLKIQSKNNNRKSKPKSKKRKLMEKVTKTISKQEGISNDSANENNENRLEKSFVPESPTNIDDDSSYFNQPFEEFIESMSSQNEMKNEGNRMTLGDSEDMSSSKKRQKTIWTVDTCSTSGEPIYKCIYTNCSETFTSQRKCRAHYKLTHMPKRPWGKLTPTNDGTGSFLYANEWRIEKVPGANSDFKCGLCEKIGSQRAVIAHLRGFHLDSISRGGRLICPVCSFAITSGLRKFLYHMSSHWKESPEVISVGGNKFLYKEKLFFGLVSNNNENDKGQESQQQQYKCFQCPALTNSQEEILEHLRNQHDVSFMCEFCSEQFPKKRGLQMHLRAHGDHSDLTSLGEGKFLMLMSDIQWPFQRLPENSEVEPLPSGVESSVKRIPFKCGTCDSKLLSLEKMKYHIKHRHLERRTLICDLCGKSLCSETALKEHRATQHSEVDPNLMTFSCEVCNFECKSKRRLDAHKEKHMELKCPACNNTFQYKKGLHLHMKKYCRVLGTSSSQGKERNSFRGPRVTSTAAQNNVTIITNETNENNTTEYLITTISTSSSSFDHVNPTNNNNYPLF